MDDRALKVIQQGDQYYIPFRIKTKCDGTIDVVTPENVDDVRIKIGNSTKYYSDGDLIFSEDKWLFRITQDETLQWENEVKCQIQFRRGDDIYGTPTRHVTVNRSILDDPFDRRD